MHLATLDIDVEQAKAGLDEYNAALRVERNVEDEAIAAAYRAATRGLPIISLSAAVAAGGFFDNGLPRIAVVRADAKTCAVERWWSKDGLTFTDEYATSRSVTATVGGNHVNVRIPVPALERGQPRRGTTVVPPVPPRFRPKRRNARLGAYHVLWEVEKWDPTPPRDPALLRHIRGDLWAVLAVWDLTDIERHVLGQRAAGTS